MLGARRVDRIQALAGEITGKGGKAAWAITVQGARYSEGSRRMIDR